MVRESYWVLHDAREASGAWKKEIQLLTRDSTSLWFAMCASLCSLGLFWFIEMDIKFTWQAAERDKSRGLLINPAWILVGLNNVYNKPRECKSFEILFLGTAAFLNSHCWFIMERMQCCCLLTSLLFMWTCSWSKMNYHKGKTWLKN